MSDIQTVEDLRKLDLPTLEGRFGRYGVRLHELARGIDNNEVIPDRPTQSVSAEDTFESDVPLIEIEPMIRRLAEKAWTASRKEVRIARTVVLKLKTSEFKILTRSHTPHAPPSSCEQLTDIALSLRERINLSPTFAILTMHLFSRLFSSSRIVRTDAGLLPAHSTAQTSQRCLAARQISPWYQR